MASTAAVKSATKRFVGHPEDSVPVVTSKEWIAQYTSNPLQRVFDYCFSLFPILGWIGRYNFGWLSGDLIAGITVGIVVVPQSMSYAQVATLAPQYGLYSAFVGVFIYCFFATSKDVSIGPVAVMSLTVSQIIAAVDSANPGRWEPQVIATAVSFICGFIVLGIGLLRIGWIVEFIPAPAVSGFMTGSAINIVAGQVPGLMGITGFDTRAATYLVIINSLKGLPRTTLDAAFGLTGLVVLYMIRIAFDWLTKRYPRRARIFFFMSIMRNGFVIIILTIASWLYTRDRRSSKGTYPIKILETVPAGFQNVGPPFLSRELVSALGGQLPVATVILLLEHIAISKSFGRVNGYTINPNQELIAIGVTNTIGSLFNAYPATGSFSRSALKSKSGVRTPIAGIFTGVVVIVALYGLTPAFYWIPTAGLSAIIIHAVADLVAKPKQVYAFWRISPLEFIIWFATVLVTVFATIEIGVYVCVIASLVLLLIRVTHPRGNFLGKVVVRSETQSREVFVPLEPSTGSGRAIINQHIKVDPPYPGVLVYRYEESLLYPNSYLLNSRLVKYVKENTRRGKDMSGIKQSDRPWNDPGPKKGHEAEEMAKDAAKPLLKAIVLDFSAISQIDTTGVQALVDTRVEVERWVDRPVEFHFANVLSPWIRRGLLAGGFGTGIPSSELPREVAPVVSYGDLNDFSTEHDPTDLRVHQRQVDPEIVIKRRSVKGSSISDESENTDHNGADSALVQSNTPFFHFDLETAVRAAEAGAQNSDKPDEDSSHDEGKEKHEV